VGFSPRHVAFITSNFVVAKNTKNRERLAKKTEPLVVQDRNRQNCRLVASFRSFTGGEFYGRAKLEVRTKSRFLSKRRLLETEFPATTTSTDCTNTCSLIEAPLQILLRLKTMLMNEVSPRPVRIHYNKHYCRPIVPFRLITGGGLWSSEIGGSHGVEILFLDAASSKNKLKFQIEKRYNW
jgi:hypothetical protein